METEAKRVANKQEIYVKWRYLQKAEKKGTAFNHHHLPIMGNKKENIPLKLGKTEPLTYNLKLLGWLATYNDITVKLTQWTLFESSLHKLN